MENTFITEGRAGLGLRSLYHMNLAFLTKIKWRMLTENDSLWVKVLSGKHVRAEINIANFKAKNMASNVWQKG